MITSGSNPRLVNVPHQLKGDLAFHNQQREQETVILRVQALVPPCRTLINGVSLAKLARNSSKIYKLV
jgi:hypothetical protein